MSDIKTAIEDNAKGPKKAADQAGSMEQHALPDQIAADRYLASKTATKNTHRGLRFSKFVPPGT